MIATPCPASASVSKVCGVRLSMKIFGLTWARRQAASNTLEHKIRRKEKQGMRHQTTDVDCQSLAEAEAWMAGREQIDVLQGDAAEAFIVRAKDRSEILSEVNLLP